MEEKNMRFYNLIGLSDKEANDLILQCPKLEMRKALDNPATMQGKLLVFRGNSDGFATDRLCVRTFAYIENEDRWQVADATVYDMFASGFDYHFSSQELESKFEEFCNASGFVMDA